MLVAGLFSSKSGKTNLSFASSCSAETCVVCRSGAELAFERPVIKSVLNLIDLREFYGRIPAQHQSTELVFRLKAPVSSTA